MVGVSVWEGCVGMWVVGADDGLSGDVGGSAGSGLDVGEELGVGAVEGGDVLVCTGRFCNEVLVGGPFGPGDEGLAVGAVRL